jgi:hypothetical protein
MVTRLLAHEVPMVAPLCALRRYPFWPSLFHEKADGHYAGYTWAELAGQSGLLAVDAMGGPGVVIRKPVLDALRDPWYENHPLHRESPHEDLYFFSKARAAGFQPFVDLDTPIGHILPCVAYPARVGIRHGVQIWATDSLGHLHLQEVVR